MDKVPNGGPSADELSRMVLTLTGVFLMLVGAALGWSFWLSAHSLVGGPANESFLFRTLDPELVIKQFRDEHQNHAGGDGSGTGQGINSVHHTRNYNQSFTMRADQEQELLNALRKDIVGRLNIPGATIVATDVEATGKSTYKYISGNSAGSISVQVTANYLMKRRCRLPAGLEDVVLTILQDEMWTRPRNETPWWLSRLD